MDWLIATLIAMSLSGFVSLTDKYVLNHLSVRAYMFLISVLSLFSLILLPWSEPMPVHWWFAGIGIGILFFIAIHNTFRAWQQEEISRIAPLGVLSTILVTIGGFIFFNEALAGTQYIAIGLFIAGSLLLSIRRTGKRMKTIKGLWWFLAAIAFAVPYNLLAKNTAMHVGFVNAFISIRIGLFVGGMLLILGHWHETKQIWSRAGAIATVKEGFGMTITFLVLTAMSTGPIGLIMSILSAQNAIVFLGALLLGRIGLLQEEVDARSLLQKGIGVLLVISASLFLFI